ncbi:DUF1801 domain-containing protein [Lacinutrix neustonica]|uniref:DUF1801 domain-containing protein n=1 Tax=Lacinutrix neustonica TaxID=2980107 RepID=A0A9E8MXG7_9FLAO|nr:DUF1801 domain-containing protein [Lacinutrix neustonica]WAC03353.1 DUF1801 domain-containing protein [Lacinutrix neustonica]
MNPAAVYILNQPEPYRSMLMHVQTVIEQAILGIELKYKWHMPCYYVGKRPICYIRQSKDYVDVAFWHSSYITKYTEHLIGEKRKIVKSLRYKTLEQINDTVLRSILEEVHLYKDKSFYKKER